MRIIYQNLKSFCKNHTGFFILMIITIFSSSIIMLFSYGLFQNYKLSKIKYTSDQTTLVLSMPNADSSDSLPVTKAEIETCLSQISSNTYSNVEFIWVMSNIDDRLIDSRFRYKNNMYESYSAMLDNIKTSGIYVRGRYFSDSEYNSGTPLLLISQDLVDETNQFTLQGNRFDIVTVVKMSQYIEAVFTALNDETVVQQFTFLFKNPPSQSQYNEIQKVFSSNLGSRVNIHEMEPFYEEDYWLYNTIMLASVLIALVASINLIILYQYILMKRKKSLAIFMLCGCKKLKAVLLYLSESLIVTIPCFIVSALIYHNFLIKLLSDKFPYIASAYSIQLYTIAFAIYVLICGIGMFILCNFMVRKNSIIELKAGATL